MQPITRIVPTILVFIFAVFTVPAQAVTIHVPADQLTIQAAVDAAVDGDSILVDWGTYAENIIVSFKGIQIQSVVGSWGTIIDGRSIRTVVTFEGAPTSGAVLDGFTIRNGYAAGDGGGLFCSNHASPTITNCTITNNSATNGGGIRCEMNSSPKIEGCSFHANDAVLLGGAISCYMDSPIEVTNCFITSNAASNGGGITCTFYSCPMVMHSVIALNVAYDRGGGISTYWYSEAVVVNSVIWNNSAPLGPQIYAEVSTPDVTYSDIQGGWPGAGNIEADPLFYDDDNFHLAPDSPCIDAGTPVSVVSDIDGDPRPWQPNGGGWDMGADEFKDEDADGWASWWDCEDTLPHVNPGVWEHTAVGNCDNGLDDDCDGMTDWVDMDCCKPPCCRIANRSQGTLVLYLIPVLALAFIGWRVLAPREQPESGS